MKIKNSLKRLMLGVSVISLTAFVVSCDDDFQEINTNPLQLSTDKLAESDVLLGQSFAQATYTSNMGCLLYTSPSPRD